MRIRTFFVVILISLALVFFVNCDESRINSTSAHLAPAGPPSNHGDLPSNLIQPTKAPDPEEVKKELEPRRKIIDQWIMEADKIAKSTGDETAQKIVEILRANGVVCKPHEKGVLFLESAKPNVPWIGLVALLPDEVMPDDQWKNIEKGANAGAHYFPDSNTIVLKANLSVSAFGKGIMLLHEGNHAGINLFTPYDQANQQLYSMDERNTHGFQNALTSQLGGDAYQKLLDAEVLRLKKGMATSLDGHTTELPQRTEYLKELDRIFGPAESDFEKAFRQTSFWIHAYFVVIEQEHAGDHVEERQANFLMNLYQQGGVLKN